VPLGGSSSSSLTYEPFYGLSEKPFSLSSDPRFLFRSAAHGRAFEALSAGIRRREGLIVLTGEIGMGKTTLCKSVLQHLDRRTFAAFVPDPFVSREDLLKMLLVDFGAISISDLKRGRLANTSRLDLSYLLYDFLDSLVPLQAFAVLVIDEAQNLPLPLLEEIRILSDLERREKLLQIVLVGQPELRSALKLTQMRQVEQRVSVRCELAALDADGVAGYVNYRLAVASDGRNRAEFTPDSLDAVYQGSSGVPRLINRICDRALQGAYSSRAYRIDPKFVWEALDDLELTPIAAVETAVMPEVAAPYIETPAQYVETPTSYVEPPAPSVETPGGYIETPPPLAPPSAIKLVTPATEEVPEFLAEFAAEADLFGPPGGFIRNFSTWHRWATVALAVFLGMCAFGASLWYLNARTVSSAAVRATVPVLPPRPAFNYVVTRRILLDATLLPTTPDDSTVRRQ